MGLGSALSSQLGAAQQDGWGGRRQERGGNGTDKECEECEEFDRAGEAWRLRVIVIVRVGVLGRTRVRA